MSAGESGFGGVRGRKAYSLTSGVERCVYISTLSRHCVRLFPSRPSALARYLSRPPVRPCPLRSIFLPHPVDSQVDLLCDCLYACLVCLCLPGVICFIFKKNLSKNLACLRCIRRLRRTSAPSRPFRRLMGTAGQLPACQPPNGGWAGPAAASGDGVHRFQVRLLLPYCCCCGNPRRRRACCCRCCRGVCCALPCVHLVAAIVAILLGVLICAVACRGLP